MKYMEQSKTGTVLGTVGGVSAAIFCLTKGSPITKTLMYTAMFGIGGLLIGNAITKFYE